MKWNPLSMDKKQEGTLETRDRDSQTLKEFLGESDRSGREFVTDNDEALLSTHS
jgi:hypothetical protein